MLSNGSTGNIASLSVPDSDSDGFAVAYGGTAPPAKGDSGKQPARTPMISYTGDRRLSMGRQVLPGMQEGSVGS
jgi:hypothetical protein